MRTGNGMRARGSHKVVGVRAAQHHGARVRPPREAACALAALDSVVVVQEVDDRIVAVERAKAVVHHGAAAAGVHPAGASDAVGGHKARLEEPAHALGVRLRARSPHHLGQQRRRRRGGRRGGDPRREEH
eukprot:7389491-Prymnesium_polylepis.2